MDISGSHRISAPRAAVWAGLNDPEILKDCIAGCERLEKADDGSYEGVVASKVGPIRAALDGRLTVSDPVAPERCRLTATGLDPVAGGGEGSADVTLEEDGDGTVVSYAGTIEPKGKIAQLGSRLVLGVARTQIEAFFTRFSEAAADGRLPGGAEAPPLAAALPAEMAPLGLGQPALAPAEAEDAPPLAPGVETAVSAETPIAPTAVPDVPDPAAIAAAEQADPKAGGAVTRIMLVAAIVVVIGVAVYWFALQAPPPA